MFSCLRRTTRLSAIVPFAAIVLNASAASAQPPLGSASRFAVLAGAAVTCTDSTVTGDVGVWPGTTVTQTRCPVEGTVHDGANNLVARQAYRDFISAYNNLLFNPPACRATLSTLDITLSPGVYCVDATAKAGVLTLDGPANAVWIFLVKGALTGTNFEVRRRDVVMINGGQPCNVFWWVQDAATMTDSKFLGTILAGAAITVTGGTFDGAALATAAVTLTGTKVSACQATRPRGGFPPVDKCEARHDGEENGDDHDKDRDHDKDKGKDKDHKDNDRQDKDHTGKDKKRG